LKAGKELKGGFVFITLASPKSINFNKPSMKIFFNLTVHFFGDVKNIFHQLYYAFTLTATNYDKGKELSDKECFGSFFF